MQGRDKPFCTNISGNAGGFGFRFRSAGADCWSLWCRISFLADPGRFLFCFRWLSFGNPLCDFLHTIRGGTIRFPVAIMFIIFRYRFYNFIQCCLGVWIYNVSYFQYYTTVTTKLVLYSLYLIHGCFGPPQAENFGGFTAYIKAKSSFFFSQNNRYPFLNRILKKNNRYPKFSRFEISHVNNRYPFKRGAVIPNSPVVRNL